MSPLFSKLNLGAHQLIHVLEAPASFDAELLALQGVTVERSVTGQVAFAIGFAVTQAQLEAVSRPLAAACQGDAVLWMAYPKGTSRRYRCEFKRDTGWSVLGAAGFEPVRQVSIDEDWTALRFRRVEHIKTMRRHPEGTISQAGRAKATKRGVA